MKKLNKKLNRTRNLSIFAIAFSGVMFIMWCCNAGGFSAVSLDTFVGVIVALLAIIVTFVLGWQIFNIFELKRKIDEVNELNKRLGAQREDIKHLSNSMLHLIAYTWAKSAGKDKNWVVTFLHGVKSLEYSLKLKKPVNIESTMVLLRISSSHMHETCLCKKEHFDEIKLSCKNIRSLDNYNFIKHDFDSLYSTAMKKLKIREQEHINN